MEHHNNLTEKRSRFAKGEFSTFSNFPRVKKLEAELDPH
jgi:hypothetical protein